MKIILSPAKKMNIDTDTLAYQELPVYIEKTKEILSWLREKTYEDLVSLWKCNEAIARQNVERLQDMDLYKNLTPAILAYEGIAYQYMAPTVFEEQQLAYVQEHLRILSAFYGVLKPMDGVTPYRLEMQAKANVNKQKNLYDFWGDAIYSKCKDEDGIIINLASKEYSKCIEKFLAPSDTYITCTFCEMDKGKLVQKGTYAKMARGEMVRFMAEKQIKNPEEIKEFNRLGYVFREDLSCAIEYVFERKI